MILDKNNRKPVKKEATGPQTVSYSFGDGILRRDYTGVGTYTQLRALRKDPTVALARAMLISCIQAGSWSIEADDDISDDIKEFMEHVFLLREDFLYNAIAFGKVDFGWMGFEKIWKVENDRYMIEYLKPLLHDYTHILVTKHGRFNGYKQKNVGMGVLVSTITSGGPINEVELKVEKCLHVAFGVEAGNYYGTPLLENVRQTCDDWDDCNDGAKRYDLKLAGSHWVVKYPPGTGLNSAGETVNNSELANTILTAVESSGSIAMPQTSITTVQEILNDSQADAFSWSVELIGDKGQGKQESFSKRLKYLDIQKVRGLLMPERSLLEGEHGTKAEAGEHIGLMLTNMQEIDKAITRTVNSQLINQLVKLNFGKELVGKVRLISTPLVDTQLKFLQELYIEQKDNDINLQAVRDKLDVPTEIGGSESVMPDFTKDEDKEEEDE